MTKKVCQAGDPQRKGRLKSTLRRERSTPYFDRPKKISVQVIIQAPDHLVPFFSFFSFLFSRSWLSPERRGRFLSGYGVARNPRLPVYSVCIILYWTEEHYSRLPVASQHSDPRTCGRPRPGVGYEAETKAHDWQEDLPSMNLRCSGFQPLR